MKSFLITEKAGMTRIFDASGAAIGVTVLKVLPSKVLRLKTADKDGYEAVQVGAGRAKAARVGKAVLGQGGGTAYRVIREFPKVEDLSAGDELGIDRVTVGDLVDVTATSKGKGFQGTIKRHNFSRGPKTHGSRNYRRPGSIGGTGAARVFAGQAMPGRMGAETVTARNLAVVGIDADEQALLVRGSVPGVPGGVVVVRVTGREAKNVAQPAAPDEAIGAAEDPKGGKAAAEPKQNDEAKAKEDAAKADATPNAQPEEKSEKPAGKSEKAKPDKEAKS